MVQGSSVSAVSYHETLETDDADQRRDPLCEQVPMSSMYLHTIPASPFHPLCSINKPPHYTQPLVGSECPTLAWPHDA